MREGVSVDKFDDPLKDGDETAENTEEDVGNHVSGLSALVTSGLSQHPEEIDNGNDETA